MKTFVTYLASDGRDHYDTFGYRLPAHEAVEVEPHHAGAFLGNPLFHVEQKEEEVGEVQVDPIQEIEPTKEELPLKTRKSRKKAETKEEEK